MELSDTQVLVALLLAVTAIVLNILRSVKVIRDLFSKRKDR